MVKATKTTKKTKPITFAIDWVETNGELVGSCNTKKVDELVKEIRVAPVDIPALRSKTVTKSLKLKKFNPVDKAKLTEEIQKAFPMAAVQDSTEKVLSVNFVYAEF